MDIINLRNELANEVVKGKTSQFMGKRRTKNTKSCLAGKLKLLPQMAIAKSAFGMGMLEFIS